ncbi:MAG: hypothetical protein JWO31_1777, partial [Phycisphaerales bacterium]|nr:hypothetical protein [Phycisphaerales bacterium]
YGVLAVLVGGHLVEVATQREHWPFSPYQMWSVPSRSWDVSREMLRGVTDEPTPREVPLVPSQHFYPVQYQTVVVQLQHAARSVGEMRKAEVEAAELAAAGKPADAAKRKADAKRAEADRIVGGLLKLYEARRATGGHAGPPLRAIRLYQVTWTMDKTASAASRANPTKTALLYPPLTDAERAAARPPVADRITSEYGNDSNSD